MNEKYYDEEEHADIDGAHVITIKLRFNPMDSHYLALAAQRSERHATCAQYARAAIIAALTVMLADENA